MQLQSYTFTLDEMKAKVFGMMREISLDEIAHAKNQDAYANAVQNTHQMMLSLNKKEGIVGLWCDLMSEYWFDQHPEISDVLLLTDDGKKSGIIQKEWVASAES